MENVAAIAMSETFFMDLKQLAVTNALKFILVSKTLNLPLV